MGKLSSHISFTKQSLGCMYRKSALVVQRSVEHLVHQMTMSLKSESLATMMKYQPKQRPSLTPR